MTSSSRPVKRWRFAKSRLEAFSDGVFAIVITLLVLELKVPHMGRAQSNAEVAHVLLMVLPKIFSWVVSFFFVALIWLHHHQIMHMSTATNYRVVWINTFLLLFLSLLPFPTAMMGEYPRQPLVVMIWGLTMAMVTLTLAILYAYCTRHFLRPEYNAASVRRNVVRSFLAGPTLYFIAAICGLWSVTLAFILYVLVPFLYIMPLDREYDHEKDAGAA